MGELAERSTASELALASAVDAILDYAIFILDPKGNISSWNRGAGIIKGYEEGEILGRNFSIFYQPGDVQSGICEAELSIAEREGHFEGEGWRIRKDRSRYWANVVITAVRAPHGHLVGFSKVVRDLTERRNAEEHLRQSEERLRLLIESIKDYAIFMLDPSGNVQTWSSGAASIKGYTADQIVGRHMSRFYLPEDIERGVPERLLHQAEAEGSVEEEGWRVRRDGSRFWADVVITAVRDSTGRLTGFAKVTRDLTERELAEELKATEAQLRRFIENLPLLAWTARADGHIDYYNRRWYEYTGTTFEDMQGCGWKTVNAPEMLAKVQAEWKHSIDTGAPFEMELPLRGADGVYRWFLTRCVPLKSPDGVVVRWFGTNTDTDAQRRHAMALQEALQVRDTLLSFASHELKTPLTPLLLQLQGLERRSLKEPETPYVGQVCRYIATAKHQISKLTALINDLLDVSRITSGQFRLDVEEVDLSSLLLATVDRQRNAAQRAGSSLTVQAPELLASRTARLRVDQLICNLMENAIQYGNGQPILVELRQDEEQAVLTVTDRGIGIAPDHLPRVFDRLDRGVAERNHGGLGLGLYIARSIAEGLGGSISVQSELGKGARFTARIPLSPPARPVSH